MLLDRTKIVLICTFDYYTIDKPHIKQTAAQRIHLENQRNTGTHNRYAIAGAGSIKKAAYAAFFTMVAEGGFEPPTFGL